MAIKVSTGLSVHVGLTGSIKAAFDGGFINVYQDSEPVDADAAVNLYTPIWIISVNGDGTGLVFDTSAVGRAIVKPSAAIWGGQTFAGTCVFWRLVGSADTGVSSQSQPRIQGTCGVVGADLYMSNPVLIDDTDDLAKTLAAFSIALPGA